MLYRLLVSVILTIATCNAFAEYRVFSLIIVNQKSQATRQIQSTLDPEQYRTLYPLNSDEIIAYVDTWRCKGRTDWLQPHCENPNKEPFKYPSLGRSPASN
jgi:hypothetical protein